MSGQVVEETNIPSLNMNPSNQRGEVRQNKTPLDQCDKGGKDNSSDNRSEREEELVERKDRKRKVGKEDHCQLF